jgi:hypothetical protein
MPEPIKVDFKRRRDRPAAKPQAPKAPPNWRPQPSGSRPGGEPMIHWRAVPKFALVLVAFIALMAAWRWFASGFGH